VGAVFNRKPAVSLKRGKIGPRLLLITNRKSHMRFQLDDLGRPLHTVINNACYFRAHHKNLNEDRPTYCSKDVGQ